MPYSLYRRSFLAVGLTVVGCLSCAHVLAALILPPMPDTVRLELLVPVVHPEAGGTRQIAAL